MQIARTGEVDQNLYHPIQPMELVPNDVHVPSRVWVCLLQLALEKLQMEHDRVQWVFYFVRHASSQASAGGHSPRQLDLIFNSMNRLSVPQSEQCTDRRSALLYEVQRNLDPFSTRGFHLMLADRMLQPKCVQHDRSQRSLRRKNLLYSTSQQPTPRASQKTLDRGAHQDHTRIMCEQHEAVLQFGHDLIHVVLQRGEYLPRIAHLPPKVRNL